MIQSPRNSSRENTEICVLRQCYYRPIPIKKARFETNFEVKLNELRLSSFPKIFVVHPELDAGFFLFSFVFFFETLIFSRIIRKENIKSFINFDHTAYRIMIRQVFMNSAKSSRLYFIVMKNIIDPERRKRTTVCFT